MITEKRSKYDFIKVYLDTPYGQVRVYKHYLIARQFVKNPFNFIKVIHIDGNKLNNSLNNLRWVSHSENLKNRTVKAYGKRPYLDHAPNDIVEIISYDDVAYPNDTYYFCYKDDSVYKRFNDHKWRQLKQTPHCGYLVMNMIDINKRRHQICMHKIIKHFRTKPAEQVAEQDDE